MKTLELFLKNKGFYLHRAYGISLRHFERFAKDEKPGKSEFISLDELQKKFGTLIAMRDDCLRPHEECAPIFWFENYVVTIIDHDGKEYLLALPREPVEEAERV